jgi:hypothetical protein
VLGKEPGRTLLKRTRFARVGRLVSHGELPFFKTFGEVRDMYALSNFLTSFVVKMGAATAKRACAKARYLPRAPRGTSLPLRLGARSSAPQSRDIRVDRPQRMPMRLSTRPWPPNCVFMRLRVGAFADWTSAAERHLAPDHDRPGLVGAAPSCVWLAQEGSMLTIN